MKKLRRCLEKDPKQRLPAIGDARALIGDENSVWSKPLLSVGIAAALGITAALLLVAGVSAWIGR